MILLVVIITITCLALYFSERLNDNHSLNETLVFVVIFGVCAIPSLIIFIAFEHFNVSRDLIFIPALLPIFILAFLALWAMYSKPHTGGKNYSDDKKDDFIAEAIILTAVLSENEKLESSDNSSSSNSSGSSSSSSNSDDFFFL